MQEKLAIYCDRRPRGGIGNYARGLHKEMVKLADTGLGFYGVDSPLVSENPDMFESEGGTYFSLKNRETLDAALHHGTDSTLSWLVPKTKNSVITVHDILEDGSVEVTGTNEYRLLKKEEIQDLLNADRIVLDSFDAKNRALKIPGISEDKTRVVYLGVEDDIFKPYHGDLDKLRAELESEQPELKKIKDRKIVLSISSEEPRKNIPHVLKAFSYVVNSNPEAALVRVGYPGRNQKPENVSLINELGIEDDMVYINNISRVQIAKLQNVSETFVLPTIREGFCLVFSEANRSGLPVVAYNTTTAPEVVGPGGILVDYNPKEGENIKGLAEAISSLITNKKLREEKSNRGLEHSKKFTWENCAKNTLNVYKELL